MGWNSGLARCLRHVISLWCVWRQQGDGLPGSTNHRQGSDLHVSAPTHFVAFSSMSSWPEQRTGKEKKKGKKKKTKPGRHPPIRDNGTMAMSDKAVVIMDGDAILCWTGGGYSRRPPSWLLDTRFTPVPSTFIRHRIKESLYKQGRTNTQLCKPNQGKKSTHTHPLSCAFGTADNNTYTSPGHQTHKIHSHTPTK